MRLRRSIFTALVAAMLCLLAPISIPVGAVPVTLSVFGVCLAALISERRGALMALLLYVALGAVGLPVFAGFAGGAQVLVGPTGGYLLGYIPMALCISSFCRRGLRPLWRMAAGMILGLLFCYALGSVWYAVAADISIGHALLVGVLPFLPFDGIKLVAAGALALLLRRRIDTCLTMDHKGEKGS